jgi:hypothetical protein
MWGFLGLLGGLAGLGGVFWALNHLIGQAQAGDCAYNDSGNPYQGPPDVGH